MSAGDDFEAYVNADLSGESDLDDSGSSRKPWSAPAGSTRTGEPYNFDFKRTQTRERAKKGASKLGALAQRSLESSRQERIAEILARSKPQVAQKEGESTPSQTSTPILGKSIESVSTSSGLFAEFASSLRQLQADRDARRSTEESVAKPALSSGLSKQVDTESKADDAEESFALGSSSSLSKSEFERMEEHLPRGGKAEPGTLGDSSASGEEAGVAGSLNVSSREASSASCALSPENDHASTEPVTDAAPPQKHEEEIPPPVSTGAKQYRNQEEEKENLALRTESPLPSVPSHVFRGLASASVESLPPAPPSCNPPSSSDPRPAPVVLPAETTVISPPVHTSSVDLVRSSSPPPPPPTQQQAPLRDTGAMWEVPVAVPTFEELQSQLHRLKDLPIAPRFSTDSSVSGSKELAKRASHGKLAAERKHRQLLRDFVVDGVAQSGGTSRSLPPAPSPQQRHHHQPELEAEQRWHKAPRVRQLEGQQSLSSVSPTEAQEQPALKMKKLLEDAQAQIFALETQLKQRAATTNAGSDGNEKIIQDQERLLSGYQKENERLVAQVKEAKRKHEEERLSLFEERQKMVAEVNTLQNQVRTSGALKSTELHSRLELEAQLRALRDELAGLQEQAKAREQELKHEIDRLRKRGGEDGASQSGTNASTEQSTQIISLEHKVQELTDSLASEKKLHKKELMDLNRRVEWYIENQELVDAHAAQLKAQADEIKRLTDVARENCPQCTHNAKKLKELRRQVADMEEASRKRHPDGLADLIRAVQVQDSDEEDAKARQLSTMQEQLEKERSYHDLALRALRQEHEKVCLGLQKKVGQGKMRRRNRDHNDAASQGGSDSENKAAQRVRSFYVKKLRDAEARHRAQLAALKQQVPTIPSSGSYNEPGVRAETRTDPLLLSDNDGSPLQSEVSSDGFEQQGNHASCCARISVLEEKLMQTATALGQAQAKLHTRKPLHPEPTRVVRELEGQLEQARHLVQDMEVKASASEATCSNLQRQVTELMVEVRLQSSPLSAKCAALATKLELVEQRTEQRVADVTRALRAARQQAKIDAATAQAQHDHEVREKAAEIDRLRTDLERLLTMLGTLQHMRTAGKPKNRVPVLPRRMG